MSTAHTLFIQHVPPGEPPQFRVVRQSDGKLTEPAAVRSPVGYPVEGRPGSDLMRELRWYLEWFLDYPFPPETEHAERVLAAANQWGTAAFEALFGSRAGSQLLESAVGRDYGQLHLVISSDDPRVLAWPWEALRDVQVGGALAQTCRIERRLSRQRDPEPLPEDLPRDRVNVLLVTARPYEADVRYRSISRPLVELIKQERLPARVTLLRPPTFARLREHLRERPGYYHVLHFDGHGAYGQQSGGGDPHKLQGPQGRLVFEDEEGGPDAKTAEQLAPLLREHRIPAVVLNACQSAMISSEADDAFASVAASLLRAGVHSVVAMAYSLYVSAAQQFLPAFYRRLFESGSFAEAARAGRQQLLQQPARVCARGTYPLQDWLVPVLYQQQPVDFSFAGPSSQAAADERVAPEELPPELRDEENPYGFVGRDGALMALERAMHRAPAGLLVHGLGGVGKTTLARGFAQWLLETEGIEPGRLAWFRFDEGIRSAEYVINRLGEGLFGSRFIAADLDERLEALAEVLRENRLLIVWDNFEVVRGIEAAGLAATLSPGDQQVLLGLLKRLRGGKTKVLITSRSEEDWLGTAQRYKVSLGGLRGEERWEYCGVILRDLGLRVDREDAALARLIDELDGHPLAMRVVLPQLENRPAGELLRTIESNLAELGGGEQQSERKLFATLRFAEESIGEDVRELLIPLSLHQRFVDADFLEAMAQQVDAKWTRARVDGLLETLGHAGLVHGRGRGVYELHPLLSRYLRWRPPAGAREAWERSFVDVMGRLADALAPRELHEQRGGFLVHGVNFHTALGLAGRLHMDTDLAALLQSLGVYAQNTRNFPEAADLYSQLAECHKGRGEQAGEAAAYHQLGMIAQEQWDFAAAERWYRKSLEIKEKRGNEHGAAITYHQLGRIAEEQRDFAAAEQWYRKSLEIKENQGDEHGAAMTYHQLGRIAEEQRDFAAAEQCYRKALPIFEKLGIEHNAAGTYHQLGRIAQEQRDFAAAEQWYRKSLAIEEKQGNEHGAAITYHELGSIAQEQRDFAAAEQWYRKSLEIEEKQGDEQGAASTYHQLGMIAAEQRDFRAAEQWYRKALPIFEKLGIEHHAASTYAQLGILAGLQGQWLDSARWLIKCVAAFRRTRDEAGVQRNAGNLLVFYRRADEQARGQIRALWEEAGLGPFPQRS